MSISFTSAAIATIISGCTSAITSSLISRNLNKKNKMRYLNDQLDDILKIAVQYPYLESSKFTKTWIENKDSESEEYLRYDIYCTLLFNYLARLAEHFNYDIKKIEKHVSAKDWIQLHQDYWLYPYDNSPNDGDYDKEFCNLITKYIKKDEKENLVNR